jgi:hypothetical protein
MRLEYIEPQVDTRRDCDLFFLPVSSAGSAKWAERHLDGLESFSHRVVEFCGCAGSSQLV